MNCPQCGGEMWDNTAPGAKKNPKGPDFKCKDKICAHAMWLPKAKAATPVASKATVQAPPSTVNWSQVGRDYYAAAYCAAHGLAKAMGCELKDLDQSAVQAGAATVLIQLEKQGHRIGALAPKPKVPKPPTKEELAEVPEPLQDGEEVPF